LVFGQFLTFFLWTSLDKKSCPKLSFFGTPWTDLDNNILDCFWKNFFLVQKRKLGQAFWMSKCLDHFGQSEIWTFFPDIQGLLP